VPCKERDDQVKNPENPIFPQFANVEDQAEESEKYARQNQIAPQGMHGNVIDLLTPIGSRPGNMNHLLKQIQAGGVARRANRSVGRLARAGDDLRLRSIHRSLGIRSCQRDAPIQ
jgi:hypothetical protein